MPADAAEIVRLTWDERDVLNRLVRGDDLGLATRHADRVRQRLRRLGYIAYCGSPRRWQISEAGLRARAAQHDHEVG